MSRSGRSSRNRPTKGRAKLTSSPGVSFIGEALRLWVRALPRIIGVTVLGGLPIQLLLAWIFIHQGLEDDALWQMQYQGIADWVMGSLVIAALYQTIHGSLVGDAGLGWTSAISAAFRRGFHVWVGMFVTRMIVSVVVGVAMFPVLGGLWVAGRLSPRLTQVMGSPENIMTFSAAELAPLLIIVPLLIPPFLVFLRYALVEPIVAIEGIDGFEALQRSKALTTGARWSLVKGLLPLVLPLEVLSFIVASVGSQLGPWGAALLTTTNMVLLSTTGCLLVVYYRIRGGDGGAPPARE